MCSAPFIIQKVWSFPELVNELRLRPFADALLLVEEYITDRKWLSAKDSRDAIRLRKAVLEIRSSAKTLGREFSESAALRVVNWIDSLDSTVLRSSGTNEDAVLAHLTHLQETVLSEFGQIRFYGLAGDRSGFYENIELFGRDAINAFPSAAYDIAEAMRCLGLEVNTAAVFHLMRVAEHGLRALANDRKIDVKGPLELSTWEKIIEGLEGSEQKIHNYPKTIAREQQYAFYHGSLMELRRFKNVWRNNIMHARDEYDRNAALSVFNHVRDFMSILAARIGESSTPLPEQWGPSEVR